MQATQQELSIQYIDWINAAMRQIANSKADEERQVRKFHRIKTCLIGCVSGVLLAITQIVF